MAAKKRKLVNSSESTSTTLIEKLKNADDEGWQYFSFAYRPLIVHWAIETGASSSDASDIAQEVMSNVTRALKRFEKGNRRGAFRKWLKTITQRRVIDHLRMLERTPQAMGGSTALREMHQLKSGESVGETQNTPINEHSFLLQRTLEYLRGKVRPHTFEAFRRVVIEDGDPKQVARDLDIDVNVVYQACSRMLSRLREAMGDDINETHD